MSLLRNIFSQIKNVAWTIINPATEEKQDSTITHLSNIEWYTDWIESSLSSIDTKVSTSDKQDTWNWFLSSLVTMITNLYHTNIHTSSKELCVYSEWHVCADNSTSTPLWINWIFTWNWQDTLDYTEVIVSIFTNQPSLTDWLLVEWSSNWADVHWDDTFTISASSGKTFSFPCQNRYVRITYKNDWVAQTQFALETLLKRFASKWSSHRLKDNLVQEDDAIVTKSLIAWFSTAWGWTLQNVKVSPSWSVQVWWTLDEVSKSKSWLVDENWVEHQMLWDTIFAWSPVVIDTSHHEIHCWDSFLVTHNSNLNSNANSDILIIVPNEAVKKYHLQILTWVWSECIYSLYEGPTITANWTSLSAINRERNSTLTSWLLFYHTPTITATWTIIDTERFWAKHVFYSPNRVDEFVLKNNTKYLLRLKNNSWSESFVSWKLNHYIHPWI